MLNRRRSHERSHRGKGNSGGRGELWEIIRNCNSKSAVKSALQQVLQGL